ncbi:paired immunoglobulin-like type 2 receptor alpha [Pteronotus mesoamericanus]|uniref:paired immunoglobulin-like type 2 receptor alpha n=1 Tax=Pteronotus mesoamericanus TaxID=1884717 RepID=UPI0023EC8F03|nr:paired immunoglobulin-like type 2 receptor alpha [Pteronotus parnellii mesoamericanus]
MCLPLLLPLLLLPASLQAGGSAKCTSGDPYKMIQPIHLSAPEGGSIHIPFSFCYGWKFTKVPSVRISWRRGEFHGQFIYNTTPPFTHKDYKGRLSLHWTKGQRNGSLQISNLRREDELKYFCRVHLSTQTENEKVWQSIEGTQLTITRATEKPTEGATSTIATTTNGVSVSGEERASGTWPLTPGAIVGVALASAVLIIASLGLMVYLGWKRSKGLQTKARAPDRGSSHNTEEKYENVGRKEQHEDPKLGPKVDGILYASLVLSGSTSPSAPPRRLPHNSPQEETVYSTLKA